MNKEDVELSKRLCRILSSKSNHLLRAAITEVIAKVLDQSYTDGFDVEPEADKLRAAVKEHIDRELRNFLEKKFVDQQSREAMQKTMQNLGVKTEPVEHVPWEDLL